MKLNFYLNLILDEIIMQFLINSCSNQVIKILYHLFLFNLIRVVLSNHAQLNYFYMKIIKLRANFSLTYILLLFY